MPVIEARASATDPVTTRAALAVLSAVPSWWARRARLVGLPVEWWDWRRALPEPPVILTDNVAEPLVSASGYTLGEAYSCALSHPSRVAHGRYYTPKVLADALWMELDRTRVDRADGPTVDHACGAGALMLRPLQRFVAQSDASPARVLTEVANRFIGIDNDALAVWLGNAVLAAELLPLWSRLPAGRRRQLPRLLHVGNGLQAQRRAAGMVVMNPPFGRAALSAGDRIRWSGSLHGHANWYGVFLHAAVERIAPGGLIGAVLPTSFLGGAYYQRLRSFLAREAPLVRLKLIDDRSGVFASGVLQETCLAVFHRGVPGSKVFCSTQSVNGRICSTALGRTAIDPSAPDQPWVLPRVRGDRRLIGVAATQRHRLRDFGWRANTGPLVWNRHKCQISHQSGRGRVPIIWAADLETGHIRRNPAREQQRWIKLRSRDEFMRLSEPAILVQRTTAPEQPRRLVAAALTASSLTRDWGGAAVVENHVNVLRCASSDSPLTPEMLAAMLNSPTYDRLYRCMTGTVAVSAYELEALALPSPMVLRRWAKLAGEDLNTAIANAFA